MRHLRHACAEVAERARSVRIETQLIPRYATTLPLQVHPARDDDKAHLIGPDHETRAAYWLTLDAINFGSGWFPTLRKRQGHSGYQTIAAGLRDRFETIGPWSANQLATISTADLAEVFGQDRSHELVTLFACSLNDLGTRIANESGGSFTTLIQSAENSAVRLAKTLGSWSCFADCSRYEELTLPFLKRAQIAAADLARAGVWNPRDRNELTMFADNLVPHVLRLDGVLRFDPVLVQRIVREELIEHGSAEEVEIRATALHAVELIVAARPGTRAMDVDQLLWQRGQGRRYKAQPRHRTRCTAY